MKIFKYKLERGYNTQIVEMHKNPIVLDCQIQNGEIVIWAIVDPKEPIIQHVIGTYMTGESLYDLSKQRYIATITDAGYVIHVFHFNFNQQEKTNEEI